MIQYLRNLRLHSMSFWAGFIAATLFWWLVRIIWPALKKGWQKLKTGIQSARQGLLTNTDQRHRIDTLKYVQGLHLASPLFSLDEVLVTPRLMAPPPIVDPDLPPPDQDIVDTLILFAPEWPEMSAVYEANTLDVFQVLDGGANIALIGNPGMGKTTTLAYVASELARKSPKARTLQNYIPVFIHATDLNLPADDLTEPLAVILEAVSSRASTLTLPRLSEMIRTSFEMGSAVFLLDGLDELPPKLFADTVLYLGRLMAAFPKIRVMVSASPYELGGIPTLGLVPVPVASWGQKIQAEYIQQWGDLWRKYIMVDLEDAGNGHIDPVLLNGWLLNLDSAVSPFEFTLKVWSAYAGDARGPRGTDAIEAYIQRMTINLPESRKSLELMASQLLLNLESTGSENQIHEWISTGKTKTDESEVVPFESSEANSDSPQKVASSRLLSEFTQNGLLANRSNMKVGFGHPVIEGYLAGFGLARQGIGQIFSEPAWPMREIASQYLSQHIDLSNQIQSILSVSDDPLLRKRLILGRWIQNIPQQAAARKLILQRLSNDLQDEKLAMGLRIRILSALAASGDPGVASLFRHLINAPSENVRQLAVLGCGYLRDFQSVGGLIKALGDLTKIGQAACLALVNIGTKPALEAVTTVLLQGNEQLRRAAAESFATHPSEGYPILKDGSAIEDLLVRRAVIYGLKRVNQPWATQILAELQIEDAQWVVKDAATQAVTQLNNPHPSIPKPQPPLHNLPWLIAFAGDREFGISEGKPARDMLLRALSEGNEDQQLAALGQIQRRGETGIFPAVYHHLYGHLPELREAAFLTIWLVASMGSEIPPPYQFGLG